MSAAWTFLSNHGHVLVQISRDPDVRIRDIADEVGITERRAHMILGDLEAAGYITITKVGRRSHYRINRGGRADAGAAAEVSVRAGMLGQQTHQKVIGVIENMSSTPCPHCGEPMDLFGFGGGSIVADVLTRELGTETPLLTKVPFDVRLREGGVGVGFELAIIRGPLGEFLVKRHAQVLHDPFEEALRTGHVIPVCFVSAQTGAGVELLLRTLAEIMPMPNEGNPPLLEKNGKKIKVNCETLEHTVAHVYKVSVDPYMGKLAYLRVYQGEINAGSQLYIGESNKGTFLPTLSITLPMGIAAIIIVINSAVDTKAQSI